METVIYSIAINSDGRLLVGRFQDGSMVLWDIEIKSVIHSVQEQSYATFAVAISPDGEYIVSVSQDYRLIVRETQI